MCKSKPTALKHKLVLHGMKQGFGILLWILPVLLWISCQNNTQKFPDQNSKVPINELVFYSDQIIKYPDSMPLYQTLLDTLVNRGEYLKAAELCNAAYQHATEKQVGWLMAKGDFYRMAKQYDSAISAYNSYLQIMPDDEQVFLNLANTYAEKGDSTTLKLSRQIAQLFPNEQTKAKTAFINGLYYNITGNFSLARTWFDSAITLQYHFMEAWMERGYSFYDEKKWEQAEKNFFQLTQLDKSNPDAWYWLAKSSEANGKKEKALVYYKRAFSLDGNLKEAQLAIEKLSKN